jgi:serine/threonine protein kinase
MKTEHERLKEILAEAAGIDTPEARATYLDAVCQGDADLRQRVTALLAAHDRAGDFLAHSVVPPEAPPASEGPGTVIGRYKLLEEIGEGGFGRVFMAEQTAPVHRKVALKIIKAGMDTREVIARFEAERQALALMDHPNIAHVLDAGATDTGRPYIVMELVRGIPLTAYCDQQRLSTGERLRLFMQVCAAVQHAHQKGIIHRDLKPSNILVTLMDGAAVPKVIDFGVAKALGQQLTEKTLFTVFQQMIGTPAYMSPEQAALSGVDVDTRSDIYSLGVLLYELLTGVTPFDPNTLRKVALDEIRRVIRETDPPKPSTRLMELARGQRSEVRGQQSEMERGPRRSGLDRHEVPGKGPRAPLRDGLQPGAGHRAAFAP